MKLARHVLEILAAAALLPLAWILRLTRGRSGRVLVVGWWGSETVGDVAILGQLLGECEEVAPRAEVAVASFNPEVTNETLRELGRGEVMLIPIGIRSGWAAVRSRCVLYGGGPLMDSHSMPFWALRALAARLAGARVMLYACGIGPVRRRQTRLAVSVLLQAATHVVLRDEVSGRSFESLLRRKAITVSFDPAHDYVARLARPDAPRARNQLALALRFPTHPYLSGEPEERAAERLLEAVSAALNRLSRRSPGLRLLGLVMHTGYADSDDHRVYARLRKRLDAPDQLRVPPGRHSVADVVQGFASSAAALTVRFHGMVFALATRTPFVAIDYSGPSGKVRTAAEFAGAENGIMDWEDLEGPGLAEALFRALRDAAVAPSSGLAPARKRRLAALASALGS